MRETPSRTDSDSQAQRTQPSPSPHKPDALGCPSSFPTPRHPPTTSPLDATTVTLLSVRESLAASHSFDRQPLPRKHGDTQ